ncbi:MAG TPA: histidine phosphatase family protein [Stellaceae bacterium]|nr:histidine phosphatase family protein [Stellaceae bacterium]
MRRLWLLRHAKAAPSESGEDRGRPLTGKGERSMREIGAWAAERHLAPDLVLCSTSVRTRQSAAILLPYLEGKPELAFEDGLYLADIPALLERLRQVDDACQGVMVVGHNPGLHALAMMLLKSGAGALARKLAAGMPTGTLAGFSLDVPWIGLGRGAGKLEALVTPKDLQDD